MKTPAALVTAALTAAILLAASFLIATGTRGEDAIGRNTSSPMGGIVQGSPATK
ncbi:MAG: hypothetical protein QOJ15_7008 [Bradyrhizobium sp.]|jgi:hypothetical protein|nr:hypothetical protein [Bradyrhizobium sp.]